MGAFWINSTGSLSPPRSFTIIFTGSRDSAVSRSDFEERPMKNIVILGSTGSIGTNTLDVIGRFPERFRVVGLTARSNNVKLEEQIRRFKPRVVSLMEEPAAAALSKN